MINDYIIQDITGYCNGLTIKKMVRLNNQIKKIAEEHYKRMLKCKLYTVVKKEHYDSSISIHGMYHTINSAKDAMIKKYVNDLLLEYRDDGCTIAEELEENEIKIPGMNNDELLSNIEKIGCNEYKEYFDQVLKKPLEEIITQRALKHMVYPRGKSYIEDKPVVCIKEENNDVVQPYSYQVIGVYAIHDDRTT